MSLFPLSECALQGKVGALESGQHCHTPGAAGEQKTGLPGSDGAPGSGQRGCQTEPRALHSQLLF